MTDIASRLRALDPNTSFIVEAPAGSGKTDLLVRRILALLKHGAAPEKILAITFTRKAAFEMRDRLALYAEQEGIEVPLLSERLNIMTIDAFCQKVVLSDALSIGELGSVIVEDTAPLKKALLHALLSHLEAGDSYKDSVMTLFQYFDNRLEQVVDQLYSLIEKRSEWLPIVLQHSGSLMEAQHEVLEKLVAEVVVRFGTGEDFSALKQIPPKVFTKEGSVRKKLPTDCHFNETQLALLKEIEILPDPSTPVSPLLAALLQLLPLLVAHFKVILREQDALDFQEIAIRAIALLEEDKDNLMLKWDARIEHILVDEFQDTSELQFRLLVALTQGWAPGEGRSLFLVGDPKQSIYRFRNAEVGLFLRARQHGIGGISMESIRLQQNFRADTTLVSWCNQAFSQIFPKQENALEGKIAFHPSEATRSFADAAGVVSRFYSTPEEEAEGVADEIEAILAKTPAPSIAILLRARSHAEAIVEVLSARRIPFHIKEARRREDLMVLHDLETLARAVFDENDRLAWLSLLRGPGCGMSLEELLEIAEASEETTVWAVLQNTTSAKGVALREVLAPAMSDENLRPAEKLALVGATLNLPRGLELLMLKLADFTLPPSRTELKAIMADLTLPTPPVDQVGGVEILTIHQAKGLEFDHVFLPALQRRTRGNELPILLWQVFSLGEEFHFLMAERPSKSQRETPLYDFLRSLESTQNQYELMRLLYVALTRAKKGVVLTAVFDETEAPLKIPKNTFLALLSPMLFHAHLEG